MTSKGLAGFKWRRAFPVLVLIVVVEVIELSDMELEILLVEKLGDRCLVSLVANELTLLLCWLCGILSSIFSNAIESMDAPNEGRLL